MTCVSRECQDGCAKSELSSLYISVPLSSYNFPSPTSSSDTHASSLDFPESPYPLQTLARGRLAARQLPTRVQPQSADAYIPLAAPIAFGLLKIADGIPLALPLRTKGVYTLVTPAEESRRSVCSDDVSTGIMYLRDRTRPYYRRSASASQPSTASQSSHIFFQAYEEVEWRYNLEEKLGDGCMGVVYRCTEKKTGRSWACKTIQKSNLSCAEDVAGLRDEVAALRILQNHSAVVSLHEVVEDDDVRLLSSACVSVVGCHVSSFVWSSGPAATDTGGSVAWVPHFFVRADLCAVEEE